MVVDVYGFVFLEIDVFKMFDEGGDEMLVCLFVVVDDVDIGLLLIV